MNRQQIVSKARSAAVEIKARPQFLVMSIAAIILLLWVFMSSGNVSDRADRLTGVVESQQVLIDKLATQLDAAIEQGADVPAPEVVAAETPGAEVSPIETVAPGIPGERGEAGPAGETGIGEVGATGAAGQGATVEQIASAVAAYCEAHDDCRGIKGSTGINGESIVGSKGDPGETVVGPQGPPGADGASIQGPPGQNGADSQVPGPQGPGPTDEQIAAAVAAYCSVPGNCTVVPVP